MYVQDFGAFREDFFGLGFSAFGFVRVRTYVRAFRGLVGACVYVFDCSSSDARGPVLVFVGICGSV